MRGFEAPGHAGLTHVIDKGLGPRAWEDVLETSGSFIDIVKLGWGTAYVTQNLARKLGMVYFAIVGGAAALETTQIEEIEEVAWEELMPECLWKFRVKDFGPLTVGIDAHGNSLYHDVQSAAQEKLKELYARL